jgi:hypothetical protein
VVDLESRMMELIEGVLVNPDRVVVHGLKHT